MGYNLTIKSHALTPPIPAGALNPSPADMHMCERGVQVGIAEMLSLNEASVKIVSGIILWRLPVETAGEADVLALTTNITLLDTEINAQISDLTKQMLDASGRQEYEKAGSY